MIVLYCICVWVNTKGSVLHHCPSSNYLNTDAFKIIVNSFDSYLYFFLYYTVFSFNTVADITVMFLLVMWYQNTSF